MKFIKITTINGESFVNLGLVQSIEFKAASSLSGPAGTMVILTMADGEQLVTTNPAEVKLLTDFVGS